MYAASHILKLVVDQTQVFVDFDQRTMEPHRIVHNYFALDGLLTIAVSAQVLQLDFVVQWNNEMNFVHTVLQLTIVVVCDQPADLQAERRLD